MSEHRRFSCSPGGVIARGRRRLRALLLVPAALVFAVSIATALSGRPLPALLALAVALLAFHAWRMSGELEPLWAEVTDEELVLRLRRRRHSLPLPLRSVRLLGAEEIEHLQRLASAGGIVAGTGGFDSHLLGEFELYASDLRNAVLLEAGESRWVLTPDDPPAFLLATAAVPKSGPDAGSDIK